MPETHVCLEATTLLDGSYCHVGREVILTKEQKEDKTFAKRFAPVGPGRPTNPVDDEAKREKLRDLHQQLVDGVTPSSQGTEVEGEEPPDEQEEPKPQLTPDYMADFGVKLKGLDNNQLEEFAIERYGEDVVDKRRSSDKNIKAILKREKRKIAELEN